MVTTHNLGFPRIGAKRELKFALEDYWNGNINAHQLNGLSEELETIRLKEQSCLDIVPIGDFSLYDHVLDMSFLFGNIPERFKNKQSDESSTDLETYFKVARGRGNQADTCCLAASEMTKWFDTNYHYIVPEITQKTTFSLNPDRLFKQISKARQTGFECKPVIIGPITYLYLSKRKDGANKLELLESILPLYHQLFELLSRKGVKWVQVDEPALVTELNQEWRLAYKYAYQYLKTDKIKLLLTTYFGCLGDNLSTVAKLPVAGVHIDVSQERDEAEQLLEILPPQTILSLGVTSGRNIWKADLACLLDWIEPIVNRYPERIWIAPSCSLLHVPVDVDSETQIPNTVVDWLAFAKQKLEEIYLLGIALNKGRDSIKDALFDNSRAILSRQNSTMVHNAKVQQRVKSITESDLDRSSSFSIRSKIQHNCLKLPLLPTTTIGSFPQTPEIRRDRKLYKQGKIGELEYTAKMQHHIKHCVTEQEKLGLDVLVHGEPERNDMVEYFGEQLNGFVKSQFGWVQSYGSRCVKPPIIYGDVHREKVMTVNWIQYAQAQTTKPIKGMLTGPVTILNWSFVRDDQPRNETCKQIALAIRDEVLDLENAGIAIIQIDEAALREGLPLKRKKWQGYLDNAVAAFRLSANGVSDNTQIHTHMCYSKFNDIIDDIASLDADVITIETSRSNGTLLEAFKAFEYPNDIGPGVYDIHSPNTPSAASMEKLIEQASQHIPIERLWVNPDCGLKTRKWEEVLPALNSMVKTASILRKKYNKKVA
jgi:5-methyltetrahydropteroyltriglutamate--homocysteine methyltransferase